MGGSPECAWDDRVPRACVSFPTEIATHTGRVQVADTLRTHQELVENAAPRVDTSLPYHVVHYQEQRKKNPDWVPSLWNQFCRKQSDKVFVKGVKNALPEVDCTPPEQAMRYSSWRSGFRKKMEKKGLQKTKATEIMWSWQEEQTAKSHLKRHNYVIKHTPSCVDHYPPEKAMQYRAWRRKTAGQNKVDAPVPRPKSASAVRWKTTFKQLNISMNGLTKADLDAPLLDLLNESDGGIAKENRSPPGRSPTTVVSERSPQQAASLCSPDTEMASLLDDSPTDDRSLTFEIETSVPSQRSTLRQRPASQRSMRSKSKKVGSARQRPATSQQVRRNEAASEDDTIHQGRPVDFSRGLMGAYLGAASNDTVREMLASRGASAGSANSKLGRSKSAKR